MPDNIKRDTLHANLLFAGVRVFDHLFVPLDALYVEGLYAGSVPLPDLPLPGMAIEYWDAGETPLSPEELYSKESYTVDVLHWQDLVLHWQDLTEGNLARAHQGLGPWGGHGSWKGKHYRRMAGRPNYRYDRWRLVAAEALPEVDDGYAVCPKCRTRRSVEPNIPSGTRPIPQSLRDALELWRNDPRITASCFACGAGPWTWAKFPGDIKL